MKKNKGKEYLGERVLMSQVHKAGELSPHVWEMYENGNIIVSIHAQLETTEYRLVEGLLDLASILCHDAGFTPDSIMQRLEYGLLANRARQVSPDYCERS